MESTAWRPLRPDDPTQVGDYRLRGRLGGGGMGQVYLGRSRSGRQVAVKVVRAEYADDPGFRRRFRREVDLAMRVGGFWSASVLDADAEAELPWVASEFVPGPTLQQRVTADGPLGVAELVVLAAGLAEALRSFHAVNLVHRDLKPANIIVTSDGPRVIDFGIARALETATGLTATGAVLGTPAFMSPEQAVAGEVGPESDLFSLGSVLAFAATGREPFGTGVAHALLYRVVYDEPDLTGTPAPVRDLVTACLRKDPARRPTPDEVLDRLDPPAGTAGRPRTPVSAPPEDVRTVALRPGAAARTEPAPDADTTEGPGAVPAVAADPDEGSTAGRGPDPGPGAAPAGADQPRPRVLDNAGTRAGYLARFLFLPVAWLPVLGLALNVFLGENHEPLATDDRPGLWVPLAVLGSLLAYVLLAVNVRWYVDRELRVDASGVVFRSPAGTVSVPWADVADVSVGAGSFTNFTPTGRNLSLTVRLRPEAAGGFPGRHPRRAVLRVPSLTGEEHQARLALVERGVEEFAPPGVFRKN